MHPVLVYAALFIATTIGLLFIFEEYQLGSVYLLLFISTLVSVIVGKLLIRMFPSEDPMQKELEKDSLKVRANKYQREIQFIFNIVQPDPKLQPSPKRLAQSLDECFDLDATVVLERLQQYFGDSFDIATSQPLPDMVEKIKQKYKDCL